MASLSMSMAVFIGLLCEAILYGTYTVLAGGALYLLIRRPRERRYSPTNILMTTLTVLMYCMSTVHISLSIRVGIQAFFGKHASDGSLVESPNDPTVWIQLMLESLNCLMGDIIVCWRTWELWERRSRILAFPVACIVGGLVCGIGMTQALSKLPNNIQLIADNTVIIWFGGFGGFTVLSNVYSVGMIAWKAVAKMRALKRISLNISGGTYFSVLVLIIESGAIYCLALAVTLALFMADSNAVYIMADVVIHLTGIYPTIIIVLVCLQVTFLDNVTRAETAASQLGGPPAKYNARKPSRKLLSWRVATVTKDTLSSDSATSPESSHGGGLDSGQIELRSFKLATSTEQEAWGERSVHVDQEGGVLTVARKLFDLAEEE